MRHRRCPSSRPSRPGQFDMKWADRSRFNRRAASAFPPGLELLKVNLLQRALRTFCETQFDRPLRRAAEKAARLALATGYPLLVFHELFAELAISAMLESEYLYRVARRSMAA
jgi:hypothetical protein